MSKHNKEGVELSDIKEVQSPDMKHAIISNDSSIILKRPSKTICGLKVNRHVTLWNVLAIAIVHMTIIMINTYVNVQIVLLLRQPDMFNIPQSQIGVATGNLKFFATFASVISSPFIGLLYDIIGRRKTIFFGLFFASVSFILMPLTAPSYAQLMVLRILFNIFIQAPSTMPLVADYFKKDSIGKAHIIGYTGFALGEVLAVGVLFRITEDLNGQQSFLLVGIVTIIFAISLLFMITEPKIRLSKKEQLDSEGEDELEQSLTLNEDADQLSNNLKQGSYKQFDDEQNGSQPNDQSNNQSQPIIIDEEMFQQLSIFGKVNIMIKQAIQLSKENIAFPICFLASMTCKIAAILFSVFMILWITSFIETGQVKDQQEAQRIFGAIAVFTLVLNIISIPICGKLADTQPATRMIPIAFLIRFLAILNFLTIENPTSFKVYWSTSLIGVGLILENVSIDAYFMRNIKRETRGTLTGIYHTFGVLGQLILAGVGGWLFDTYGPATPYVFVAASDFALLVLFCVLICTGKWQDKHFTKQVNES